jgi:ribose 5-phosphate isomerase A
MEEKKVVGYRAASLVEDGMVIGLGTGSTFRFALEKLAQRVQEGNLRFLGVPTSKDTERKARALGVPLTTLDENPVLDLTLDGADEVDAEKNLIKGGGGALLREKVVASVSKEMVVLVGANKLVDQLGKGFLLPVEVLPFARRTVYNELKSMGCSPFLRTGQDGEPFFTDNGNFIIDCKFEGIADPVGLECLINNIPGAVENGLFVGRANRILVGEANGKVREIG